ncbi:MAG: hypothetical protein MMC33_001798 [Icmadophila ericetorum]|nr:hypothetical protein [Icmadophila ericetorum]
MAPRSLQVHHERTPATRRLRRAILADLNGRCWKDIPVFEDVDNNRVLQSRAADARRASILSLPDSLSDFEELTGGSVTPPNIRRLPDSAPRSHDRATSPGARLVSRDPADHQGLNVQSPSTRLNQNSDVMTPPETLQGGLDQRFGGINIDNSYTIIAPKRKYTIEELLRMRLFSSDHPVDLRISDEAPQDHVFNRRLDRSYDSAITNESSLFGTSGGGEGSFGEEGINRDLAQQEDLCLQNNPIRQPYGPPNTTLNQIHLGFARFIKEHASPLHNRVTAGGRIVPAGPRSPPPTFHIETIDQLLSKHDPFGRENELRSDRVSQKNFQSYESSQPAEVSPGNTQSSFRGIVSKLQGPKQADQVHQARINTDHFNPLLQNPAPVPGNVSVYQQSSVDPANKPPTLQIPDGAQLVMTDGPTCAIIFFHGSFVRATLHGAQTFLEPMQQVQPWPDMASTPYGMVPPTPTTIQAPAIPQTLHSYQQVLPRPWEANTFNQAHPVGSCEPDMSNFASCFGDPPSSAGVLIPLQQLFDAQEHFRSQLKTLEKHVAMHATDLSPFHLQQTSQHRRFLVEELDRLRKMIAKAKSQGGAPIYVQQHQLSGLQIIPSPNAVQVADSADYPVILGGPNQFYCEQDNGVVRANLANVVGPQNVDKVMAVLANESNDGGTGSTGRKALSPDAPDFVPGRSSFALESKKSHNQNTWPTNVNPSHISLTQWGSFLQNNDRTTKVEPEDAVYCDAMGYNNPRAPKLYCSTTVDFEAAIIAARLHAKYHGCLGGQSKDPEWDAEQDIRWAMQDMVPIPLPLVYPDWANNPRPWSWEDSFFNVRRSHNAGWLPPRYFREPGAMQMEPVPDVWRPRAQAPTCIVKFPKMRPKPKRRHKRTDSWGDPISDSETEEMPSDSGEEWISRDHHGGFAQTNSFNTVIVKSTERKTPEPAGKLTISAQTTPVKKVFSAEAKFSTQSHTHEELVGSDASPNPIKDKWLYKPTPTPTRQTFEDKGNMQKANPKESVLSEPHPINVVPRHWSDLRYEAARHGEVKKVADDGFRTGSPSRPSPWDSPVDNRMSSNEFRTIPVARQASILISNALHDTNNRTSPVDPDQSKSFLRSMLTDKLGKNMTTSENSQGHKKLRKQPSQSSTPTFKDLNTRLTKVEASVRENRSSMPETPKAQNVRGQKSHKSQHSIALPTYTASAVISSPPPMAANTLQYDNRQGQFAYHLGPGGVTAGAGGSTSKSVLYYTGPSTSYGHNPDVVPYSVPNAMPNLNRGLHQGSLQNVPPLRQVHQNGPFRGTFNPTLRPERQTTPGPGFLPPNQRFPPNTRFPW